MDSKIGFEMKLIVVEAIRGRCASFTVLTATVSEIFGGQTTPSILVVYIMEFHYLSVIASNRIVTNLQTTLKCEGCLWDSTDGVARNIYPAINRTWVTV